MVPDAMLGKVPTDLEICRGVIQLCPAVQPAVAYILAPDSSALPELASDKLHWWSQHIHQHLHRQLIDASTARDRAKLSCINDSHASAWLSACPSESVGLQFATSDFITDEPVATTCQLCGGFVDIYGDHYLCCPRGGFYNRHQTVVGHLSHVAKAAGLRVSFEESVPEGTRPADMLISSWPTPGTSLAIDISVIHP